MDRSLTSSFYFQISSRIQMRSTFGELSVTRRSSARRSPADTCSVLTTHFRIRSETFQMILIFTKHKMHFIHFELNMKVWLGWCSNVPTLPIIVPDICIWLRIFAALHRVPLLHLRDARQPEPRAGRARLRQVRHPRRQADQQVSGPQTDTGN